ncbi:MAG TPA: hypothetical protein VFW55_01790 [Propionicimonas sp.]|nr:hypothetical protein [Propionicimonas sp.]
MSQPPTDAASRLEFSRLFSDTFALYRRAFRPLLALGATSAVVAGGTGLTLVWLYATTLMTAVVSFNPAGLASGVLLAAAAGGLASMLVTVQSGAMIAQVVAQVADGRAPDLRAAWRDTATVVPRLLVPCLALSAATWLAAAVGLTVVLNALGAARMSAPADRGAALSTILALLGGVALGAAGIVTLSWWLRVKLFLLVPAAGLEKLAGFAPVRRSWQLTRGIAGLVFGALFVVGLAEGAVVGLGGQVASMLVTPSAAAGDFGGLVTLVAQLMPAMTVGTAISSAVAAVTWPFLTVMSTIVHRALTGYRLTPLMSG